VAREEWAAKEEQPGGTCPCPMRKTSQVAWDIGMLGNDSRARWLLSALQSHGILLYTSSHICSDPGSGMVAVGHGMRLLSFSSASNPLHEIGVISSST
jgi:hypothetical protein